MRILRLRGIGFFEPEESIEAEEAKHPVECRVVQRYTEQSQEPEKPEVSQRAKAVQRFHAFSMSDAVSYSKLRAKRSLDARAFPIEQG